MPDRPAIEHPADVFYNWSKCNGNGMKLKTHDRREQHNRRIAIGSGFLKAYAPALQEISSTIRREKPDLIVGLSRKAPRLLELLRLTGIWTQRIPVISEKALDFIPAQELTGKRILVFDDIVISGTTVTNVLSHLAQKYSARLKFVCLAIDKDTIALNEDGEHNYWVKLTNSERILLDYKVPLSKDERFIFCNQIVRSFALLNKPYDIDYPIFYASLEPDVMSSLFTQSEPDKAYNLTTVQQFDKGFLRYTFLPVDQNNAERLCTTILAESRSCPQICKIRSYSDRQTGQTAFVPIVTFSINSEFIKEEHVFSKRFSCYADLIRQVKDLVDPRNEAQAMYRLVWYIVGYLYGLHFIQRNISRRDGFGFFKPSQMLRDSDLFYIFGPSLTPIILSALDSYYERTIQELEEMHDASGNSDQHKDRSSPEDTEPECLFDARRQELYGEILPYLTSHICNDQPLTDRMATVFEGLYYLKEIPTQETIKEVGIEGYEYKRLGVGFTLPQITHMLKIQGASPDNCHDIDVKVSLALDFLVDAGIAIPIFYYERDDGHFERAYRYGEDALSAKQYGYMIASTLRRLFHYTTNNHGKDVLPRIVLEKIGVMLQEEVLRADVADILQGLLDPRDRRLVISPCYGRFGKVLSISDEAYEESIFHPFLFTMWCTREGITESVNGGLTYSDEFFRKMAFPDESLPKLISPTKLAIFESLAILLYHINSALDKGAKCDYLIALSACSDHETYLYALREELQLFFKSHGYRFDWPLTKTIEYVEGNREHSQTAVRQALASLLSGSYSAAHEIRHKKSLWDNIPEMIGGIEKCFQDSDLWLRIAYSQNLKHHVDKIGVAHDVPMGFPLRQFREEIETLGELCIYLATILRNLLEIANKCCKLRPTKSGLPHKGDLNLISERLTGLGESITAWNHLQSRYTEITSAVLPTMTSIGKIDPSSYGRSIDEHVRLMETVVPEVHSAFSAMQDVFNRRYALPVWEDRMTQLFPKGEDLELTAIKEAIQIAAKCKAEDDRIHPKVAAVVIKDEEIVCSAFRGELGAGQHAEYTALIKKCEGMDLDGATLITTLEPCTNRGHDKKPCALHIVDKGIKRVIIGTLDPNSGVRGKGFLYLQKNNVHVDLFPHDYQDQLIQLNQQYWDKCLKDYHNDLMNDLKPEPETNAKSIRDEVYPSAIRDSSGALRVRTLEVARTRFDEEQVKDLCFFLHIDYGDLGGEGKSGRIRELVSKYFREDRVQELLDGVERVNSEVLKEIVDPTIMC